MKKILALALFFGLGTSAYAQNAIEGKLEAGLGFFYGIPMASDMKDNVKSTPGFEVFADYKICENTFLGLEYGRSFDWDNKGPVPNKLEESYLGLRAKYSMPLEGGFSVYGLIGLAQYMWDMDTVGDDDGIGVSIGIGANYNLQENIFLGLEARYHFSPKYEPAAGISEKTEHMMLGIHAGYRF